MDDTEREHLQPFGKEVRAMRKAAGLTQEQLGKLAGIGITHISRLEHGRRRPSVDAIKALARVMAPEGTTDAAEQRMARLAGDSLRTGAARRKRQRDNKHRRAALKQIERARRIRTYRHGWTPTALTAMTMTTMSFDRSKRAMRAYALGHMSADWGSVALVQSIANTGKFYPVITR
ncbi:helix-turn-helix transcriptional regulator [Pseudarthrobacter sp. CC12]|uniref:helix-turn-helix domain-containing protein n=1 Tax=Pseudarthrobacter sp. CC12 TaxID=3029193 RepID=UPI003263E8F7